jgi:hypothetical protein
MDIQGDPSVSPSREDQGEESQGEYINYKNPSALFRKDGTFNSKAYNVPDLFRFSQEVFKDNIVRTLEGLSRLGCLGCAIEA